MKAKRTILLGARWKFPDFKGRFNNALSFILLPLQKSVSKNLTDFTLTDILKGCQVILLPEIRCRI